MEYMRLLEQEKTIKDQAELEMLWIEENRRQKELEHKLKIQIKY